MAKKRKHFNKILLIRQPGKDVHVLFQGDNFLKLVDGLPKNQKKGPPSLEVGIYLICNEHIHPMLDECATAESKALFNSLRTHLLRKLTSPGTLRLLPRSKLKVLTIRSLSLLTKLSKLLEILETIED